MLKNDERLALVRARELIATGQESYVCLALMEVAIRDPGLEEAGFRLRQYIWEQLGTSTLNRWQEVHGLRRTSAGA